MRVSSYFSVLVVLLSAGAAWPCNYCKNDNRSAVYSYEAIRKVEAHPDKLEFAVLKIKGKLSPDAADGIQKWLMRRPGVDAATVKISSLQKSIGFVFEKSKNLDALVADLTKYFTPLRFEALDFDQK